MATCVPTTHMTLDEKFAKVNAWLIKCFDGRVPNWEVTEKTVDFLWKMSNFSETNDRWIEVIRTELCKRSEEYAAETTRMRLMLDKFGISVDDLPEDVKNLLNILGQVYMTLDSNFDPFQAQVSLYNLHSDKLDIESELEIVNAKIEYLSKIRDDARQRGRQLTRMVKELENVKEMGSDSKDFDTIEKEKISNFMNVKDLEKQIELIEEILKERGHSSSSTYETLAKKLQTIKSLEDKLSEVKDNLKVYGNLPPDCDLAAAIVEERNKELEQVDLQLKEALEDSLVMHGYH